MDTFEEALAVAAVIGLLRDGRAEELRRGRGLTTGQVARAIGVAPETVWRWETQKRTPRGRAAVRYLELLERLRDEVAA